MRVLISSFVLVALVALAAPPGAEACECASSGPPCQNYFEVDAVFLGTVRSISEVERTTDSPFARVRVRFDVQRAMRGGQGATTEITTGAGGGDCGYPFKVGERYLVYGRRARDGSSRIEASICSRTRRLSEAAEDLQFLEGLAVPAPGARVYGAITRAEHVLATGEWVRHAITNTLVLMRGPSGIRQSRTDSKGEYQFNAVSPGSYDLQILPSSEFSAQQLERKIDLPDAHACAPADFELLYDGRITGVVVDPDGKSVAGTAIDLVPIESLAKPGFVEGRTTAADAWGNFEFTELPPGRYVLGVSLKKRIEPRVLYDRTFHPGTPDRNAATVVKVGEGNHQRIEPLQLPSALESHDLVGVVVWPEGQPVANASVSLQAGEGTQQVALGIRTDAEGRFAFVVHEGLSYVARVFYSFPNTVPLRQVTATRPFIGSASAGPLRIVLAAPVQQP